MITWAVVQRDGGEGCDEAGAAEELGDEDGGVGLRLRAVDPLDAGPENAGVAAPLAQHAAAVAAHLPKLYIPLFNSIFFSPSFDRLLIRFNSLSLLSLDIYKLITELSKPTRPAVCSNASCRQWRRTGEQLAANSYS